MSAAILNYPVAYNTTVWGEEQESATFLSILVPWLLMLDPVQCLSLTFPLAIIWHITDNAFTVGITTISGVRRCFGIGRLA